MVEMRKKCPVAFAEKDPDAPFIAAAEKLPGRVLDPSQAKLFIVTTPLVSSLLAKWVGCGKPPHNVSANNALRRLVRTETWRRTGGENHLWVMVNWRIMQRDFIGPVPTDPERGEWASKQKLLENVFVGTFEKMRNPWKCTVVVPYLTNRNSEFPTPTFREWLGRGTTLYYRNKNCSYWSRHRSRLRQMPKEIFKDVPGALVGHAVGANQFSAELSSSRFCLAPAGDTPSTSKLYDIIRALCIPVIVSDGFDRVGKPFHSLLNWSTFALFLPEREFLERPLELTRRLWEAAEDELLGYFTALRVARQVLDWNAPDSRTAEFTIASAAETCVGAPRDTHDYKENRKNVEPQDVPLC